LQTYDPLNYRARILSMAQNTARNSVTAITFIVSVGFGSTQANAIAGANNTLRQNRPLLHPCMTTPPSTLRACPSCMRTGQREEPITPATSFRQLHDTARAAP